MFQTIAEIRQPSHQGAAFSSLLDQLKILNMADEVFWGAALREYTLLLRL
jgi:hypothetical protein